MRSIQQANHIIWILVGVVLSAILLKLDTIYAQKFAYSILPYAWIGVVCTLLLIYFARKVRPQALKLTLSYLTILPLCLIVGEAFFYHNKLATSRLTQPHRILGFSNIPNLSIHTPFSVDGKLIYDPTYTHDANGNRITPNNPESNTCINLYGGSFAYGSGLDDSETLAAFLARSLPAFHINNFGIGGAGAHQMLARLEFNLDHQALAQCREHIFFYVIIPHHIYRSLGAVLGPKYALDSAHIPQYQGVFTQEARKPFYKDEQQSFTLIQRLHNQLEKSSIFQYISNPHQSYNSKDLLALESYQIGVASHPDIHLPISDTALYFAIVRKIQATLQKKYNAKLYALVYDYDMHAQFLDQYDGLIQDELRKAGISFTTISEILGDAYKHDLERVKGGGGLRALLIWNLTLGYPPKR